MKTRTVLLALALALGLLALGGPVAPTAAATHMCAPDVPCFHPWDVGCYLPKLPPKFDFLDLCPY